MKRIRTFCILLIVLCTLTSCWSRDDPWHPYYYNEYETEAKLIAAYEGTPSDDYLIIPDSRYRFILKVEGVEKTFGVPESYYYLHKDDDTIPLLVEKKFKKGDHTLVDTEYYLVR